MTREVTDRILAEIDEGILDPREVVLAALKYMSEDDVADMAHINEFFPDEEDYEDDGQPDSYTEYQDLYGGDDAFETCSYYEDY